MVRRQWLRAIVVGGLSALLVPISWALTLFVTLGFAVVHFWLSTQPPSFVGHLNEGVGIAAGVDFAVWFAGLWGASSLWTHIRTEMPGGDATGRRSNPLRRPRLLASTTLCALPFSYYALLGMVALWNHSRLPESALIFAALMALSLAVFSAAIGALYVLAAKLRWASAARNKAFTAGGN